MDLDTNNTFIPTARPLRFFDLEQWGKVVLANENTDPNCYGFVDG